MDILKIELKMRLIYVLPLINLWISKLVFMDIQNQLWISENISYFSDVSNSIFRYP